jgi:hypothetical protein
MQKLFVLAVSILASVPGLRASTLLQLSLNDMIRQSTSIVQGKAQLAYAAQKGSVIYTHYQIQVSATLKGTHAATVDVAIMGGVSNGVRQSFAGAPELVSGQDYVLFLWTSKSGLTQIIGLSQGLFRVSTNSSGQAILTRAAGTELMLNAAGQPVTDSDYQISLSGLQTRMHEVLNGAAR